MNYPKPKHDNRHIYELKYDIDIDKCLNKFNEVKDGLDKYSDVRYAPATNWRLSRLEQWDYADQIMSDLGLKDYVEDYRPRFYTLDADSYLMTHVDLGTKCSLNFIVQGEESPATFEGVLEERPDPKSRFSYLYKSALFNTTLPHGVVNDGQDRILFKISIMDKDYEDIREKIKEHVNEGFYDKLGGDPEYEKFRELWHSQETLGDKYYDLHTQNLIPTNIKIDLELFDREIKYYQNKFEQWGPMHTDLPRTGMALTLPKVDYPKDVYPNPSNWPMDTWCIHNPDFPLVDSLFTEPTPAFKEMKSLQPLMIFKEHFGRCNLLRWHNGAKFFPHMDVFHPFHNLRLWGTNDPDNYHFYFWDELKGKYIREENVEAGRIYVADTEKWHHAYTTADNNYTFFISLQVSGYDKIRENLL